YLGIDHRIDSFRSQTIDIHCFSGNKMLNAPFDLRRATGVIWTVMLRLTLASHERRTTFRTTGNIFKNKSMQRSFVKINSYNFWNYLASLFYENSIAFADIKSFNLIGIVQ